MHHFVLVQNLGILAFDLALGGPRISRTAFNIGILIQRKSTRYIVSTRVTVDGSRKPNHACTTYISITACH